MEQARNSIKPSNLANHRQNSPLTALIAATGYEKESEKDEKVFVHGCTSHQEHTQV